MQAAGAGAAGAAVQAGGAGAGGAGAAPAAEGVGWPWKPRDLEALQQRFKLVVDPGGCNGSEGCEDAGDAGSVLTWSGFLMFWSGLQNIMPEVTLVLLRACNFFE
jgi:hypothetical protein